MVTTPNLGLVAWNLSTDPYDPDQLATNWYRVDEHDHTFGKGRPITTGALADAAVTQEKIAPGVSLPAASISAGQVGTTELADSAVTTAKILDGTIAPADLASNSVTSVKLLNGAVTNDKLDPTSVLSKAGITSTGTVRRGTSIQTGGSTGNFTSTAWALAPQQCKVTGLVCPANSLLSISFKALLFKGSPTGVGPILRAGLSIGPTGAPMDGTYLARARNYRGSATSFMSIDTLGSSGFTSNAVVYSDPSQHAGVNLVAASGSGDYTVIDATLPYGPTGELLIPMPAGTWDVGLIYSWNVAGTGGIPTQALYCKVEAY